MITSGLVLTLTADPALARQAQTFLQTRPELTLGQCDQRWLPAVAEVATAAAGRDLHDWLSSLPGVEFVDVVQVNFEETAPDASWHPHPTANDEGAGTAASPQSDAPTFKRGRGRPRP